MNIGIVGLGLIGGSLAIDLSCNREHQLLGISRRAETCRIAQERGIVHQASTTPELMANADIIFLCTPLGAIEDTVRALVPYLNPKTVLTDVGSVKAPIVQAIAPLWPNFVGGHPMAGTTNAGIDAAIPHLFEGRPYVLTPTPETPPQAIATVASLVEELKSVLHICEPTVHDQAVALISHLPVMVSASLIATCMQEPADTLNLAQQLASSGFRDTSRVGGGNPELGVMMATFNRTEVLRSLKSYRNQLDTLIDYITQQDWPSLEATLTQTQQARPNFVD